MAPSALTPAEVDNLVRPLTLKDLRIQTRARGLTPAGGQEALRDRLKADMLSSGDFALKNENGEDQATVTVTAGLTSNDMATGKLQNNYTRAAGQNVGNFLTDRSSSRVLAPPGGVSQISFGDCEPASKAAPQASANPILGGQQSGAQAGHANNNYSRPGGQNVGNFLTDRNSSRVLAPPGGASQIHFG